MRIISLLFHDVVEPGRFEQSGFLTPGADVYKFTTAQFDGYLAAVTAAAGGQNPVTIRDASEVPRRPAMVLTFDDGGVSALETIAGRLEALGWRGMFFVTTSRIGTPGFLSVAQIRELDARGHVIGSHSHTHPLLMGKLAEPAILEEWTRSCGILAGLTGKPVRTASVPGGYYHRPVARAARQAGIEVLFNSEPVARASSAAGCVVLGRYSIQRGVDARQAAAIAQGRFVPRYRQWIYWNLKKMAKAAGGNAWLALRSRVLHRTR